MRGLVMWPRHSAGVIALAIAASAWLGCTAVLGDFSVSDATGDGGPVLDGAVADQVSGDVAVGSDGGDATPPSDSGDDAPADAGPPDVGPPGAPGFGLSAGATVSKSASFKVYGVLGESPGGNTTSKSASYKLTGGVIGATK